MWVLKDYFDHMSTTYMDGGRDDAHRTCANDRVKASSGPRDLYMTEICLPGGRTSCAATAGQSLQVHRYGLKGGGGGEEAGNTPNDA